MRLQSSINVLKFSKMVKFGICTKVQSQISEIQFTMNPQITTVSPTPSPQTETSQNLPSKPNKISFSLPKVCNPAKQQHIFRNHFSSNRKNYDGKTRKNPTNNFS